MLVNKDGCLISVKTDTFFYLRQGKELQDGSIIFTFNGSSSLFLSQLVLAQHYGLTETLKLDGQKPHKIDPIFLETSEILSEALMKIPGFSPTTRRG